MKLETYEFRSDLNEEFDELGILTVTTEWVHDQWRFILWYDEEGDSGWAFVSKTHDPECGNLPEDFLEAWRKSPGQLK